MVKISRTVVEVESHLFVEEAEQEGMGEREGRGRKFFK